MRKSREQDHAVEYPSLAWRSKVPVSVAVARRAVLLAAVGALPLLLAWPFLHEPMYGDEAVYATIAQGILNGQIPYRDLFDHKPPLLYGWYVLSFLLFGEDKASPRLLAALAMSATALLVYAQARLWVGSRSALAGAGLFALSPALRLFNNEATGEMFMVLPMTASLLLFTRALGGRQAWWFAAAGVAGGIAMMTRQTAAWNLVALVLFTALYGWRDGLRGLRLFSAPAVVIAGAAAVVAVVLAPFLLTETLDSLLDANVRFNLQYGALLSSGERTARFLERSLVFFPMLAAPLAAAAGVGLLTVMRRRAWPGDVLLATWAIASAAGVASPGWFFMHYFVQLFPAMALLAAVAFAGLGRALPVRRRTVALLAVASVYAAVSAVAVWQALPAYTSGSVVERQMVKRFGGSTDREVASPLVADYLRAHAGPDDSVYIVGHTSPIYFYADLRPAARYFYPTALLIDGRRLDETVEALRKEKPAYIVSWRLTAGSGEPSVEPDSSLWWCREVGRGCGTDGDVSSFRALITEAYELVETFPSGDYTADVYRVKALASP